MCLFHLIFFSLESLLFSGVSFECVHKAESSQVLTKNNALLHWEDAVENKIKHFIYLYTCVYFRNYIVNSKCFVVSIYNIIL